MPRFAGSYRALLLLGTEGPGLPAGLMARARTLRIPMAPGFDSLNVATAGALALSRLAGAAGRLIPAPAAGPDPREDC